MHPGRSEHETAEILVLGNQQSLIGACKRDDCVVVGTAHRLGDRDDVVPEAPQFDDNRKITALVSDEAHGREGVSAGGAEHDVLVRDGVGCILQRCLNVFAFEIRVRKQERVFIRAFGDLANDQLDGDAGSPNDRLAQHDLRVDLDSFVNGHLCVSRNV